MAKEKTRKNPEDLEKLLQYYNIIKNFILTLL